MSVLRCRCIHVHELVRRAQQAQRAQRARRARNYVQFFTRLISDLLANIWRKKIQDQTGPDMLKQPLSMNKVFTVGLE